MSEQISNQMLETLNNSQTSSLNDRVLSNVAVSLAFLSAYAANPGQMTTLFNSFEDEKSAANISVKFGVLINGNDNVNKAELAQKLQKLLIEWLQMNSGFDTQSVSDDDVFKFRGAFDLIGHLTNTFGRREMCVKADSANLAVMFKSINEAKTLTGLLESNKDITEEQFKLLLQVMAVIPVKSETLSPELSALVKSGFALIQKSYLDHQALYNLCSDAILNLT